MIAELLSQGQNFLIQFLRSQNIQNLYTFNFMYWFGKQIWKVFKGRYSYVRKYGIHYDGVSKLILNTQKYLYKCLIISTDLVTVVIRYLVKIWHDFYPIFDRDACRSSPTIHFVNLFPLLVIWVFSTQMTNNWFESYKDWGLENNTNLNPFFYLIKSSEIVFIFLPAFYLIISFWLGLIYYTC